MAKFYTLGELLKILRLIRINILSPDTAQIYQLSLISLPIYPVNTLWDPKTMEREQQAIFYVIGLKQKRAGH